MKWRNLPNVIRALIQRGSIGDGGGSAAWRPRFLAIFGLWLATLAVIFGVYELVERVWLSGRGMGVIHLSHIARGIAASAAAAIVVGLYLGRRHPASRILGGAVSHLPKPEIELSRDRAVWFIRMRWVAAGLAGLGSIVATRLTNLLPPDNLTPLMTCVVALGVANAIFTLWVAKTSRPYRLIIVQAATDLLFLTYLLHFAGGIENPFYLVYLPHVIIAGIILSRRDAFFVTLLTCLLFLSLAGLEYWDIWHHSYVGLSPHGGQGTDHAAHKLEYVVGEAIPFLLVAAFTSYFTILLRDQIERDQANVLQASKLATIGELAGRFAHEVNNPIGVVSANVKFLMERKDWPPEVTETLEIIDRHGERVASLTRGLLTFSRRSLEERSEVDLNRVIEASMRLVEPEAGGTGIRIEKRLATVLPAIQGSANELQQVVLNIASNAVAAMPGGGTLRVESGVGPDGWVSVAIADTGMGISPRIIDRIFDPFFTTKSADRGTGLGLSIAQGLVRSHGGVIHVESREGEGTTFNLRFPAPAEKEKRT